MPGSTFTESHDAGLSSPEPGAVTERFDPISCVDERARHRALTAGADARTEPGRYLQIEGEQETLLIPVGQEVLHVGRGIAADLRLDEASVSRRHALIVAHETGVRILDDRSSNGTVVNGVRVERAELRHGDVIVLGRVALRYLEP